MFATDGIGAERTRPARVRRSARRESGEARASGRCDGARRGGHQSGRRRPCTLCDTARPRLSCASVCRRSVSPAFPCPLPSSHAHLPSAGSASGAIAARLLARIRPVSVSVTVVHANRLVFCHYLYVPPPLVPSRPATLTSPQRDPLLAPLPHVLSHVRPVSVSVSLVRASCLIFCNSYRALRDPSTSLLPVPTDGLLDYVVVLSRPLIRPLLQCPPSFLTRSFSLGVHRLRLLLALSPVRPLSPFPLILSPSPPTPSRRPLHPYRYHHRRHGCHGTLHLHRVRGEVEFYGEFNYYTRSGFY
jgi:hypothetical protein